MYTWYGLRCTLGTVSVSYTHLDVYKRQQQEKVIRLYFKENKTLSEIAAETGVSLERVRQIKADGLRRLRRGKALRELEQKCEIAEADIFRGGFSRFKHTGLSSVEKIILRLDELEEQYKTCLLYTSLSRARIYKWYLTYLRYLGGLGSPFFMRFLRF